MVLLAVLLAVATQSARKSDPKTGESASIGTPPLTSQDEFPAGVGGMKAYRDPVTGERVGPPPRAVHPSAPQPSALSRSHTGLEVVPTGTAAGGVRVDLQGRFRSSVVATKRPDGSVSVRCLDKPPTRRVEE